MHCRATKVLGSRMQHGNAQPTAAHALQGKRNAWVVGCDEDNAQPTAAYAPQRKQNAWTVGCDEDNAQPAAAYALQSNEGLGQSDATRQCAAHSGARTARETKCLGCRMRRRQRAAHSDCKATKFLGSRKQPCNAQPTAAHTLQRYEIPLGLHSARYLNFRKAATCSHSSGRKWPQVAALSSGRKWPLCRVAASGRSVEWPQVAAFDAWPRYLNLRKSSHLQPLAATRVAASGRSSRVAASGREWPPLPHNVMNSKLRKTPTRSRRQPTYPSQLEKKTPFQQNIFFQDVRRLSPKSIT